MSRLRVGVWGLGSHALRNILPALSSAPAIELAAVCTRNDEVRAEAMRKYGCRGWKDGAGLLADQGIDTVFVATPTGLHAEQGRAVLAAGKHFWCDKPLATTVADAVDLVERSRRARLSIAEGFMYLYHPQFETLRAAVAADRIGRVQSISIRFGIRTLERTSFRDDPSLGGGAFLDVGSYTTSAAIALLPDREPSVEYASIETAAGSAVDTSGQALLRYDGPVVVTLDWRTHSAYRNEIDLWGTTGSVSTERIFSKPESHVPRFRFLDASGVERWEEGSAGNHFESMFTAFHVMATNEAAAEGERRMIERRARLLDQVAKHSRRQDAYG